MKNLTTLSLITASIIGLTGCGATGAIENTTNDTNDTNKIALGIIDEYGTEVGDKQALANAVSKALEVNQKELKANLLNDNEALNQSRAYVQKVYKNIDIDLANAINMECQDDQGCLDEAYASLSTPLELTHEEAYNIAKEVRGEEEALVNDKLTKEFTCQAGEIRTIKHYGIEDLFSTANGAEVAHPSTAILNTPWINNYPFPVTGYDETSNNRIFADTLTNLPSNITKGMFYIGLKSNGSALQSNDTLSIGDYASGKMMVNTHLTALNPQYGWSHQLVSSTNPTTDIYYKAFSGINMTQNGNSAGTLLDLVQNQNSMDVVVADDTSVDFITVATCSTPDPLVEISHVVDKFTCSEKEGQLLQIVGGTKDAFAPTPDQASVASANFLSRANTVSRAEYDATHYDKHLLDTLTLPTGVVINKAEFNVGYKKLNTSLYGNDTIHIGKYAVAHSGGRYILYPNGTNPAEGNWRVHTLLDSTNEIETIRTVNLNDITIGQTGTSVLNWMQGKSEFEVLIEDDTSVDFTQLNLCVTKK